MSDWCFPFKVPPELSWHGGARYFGAPRAKGRKHGGCDLIKPEYTQIYAVHDGVLVHEETLFYLGTFYVTYQHGPYLCRYGEILHGSTNGRRRGSTIRKGEPVAKVGLMTGHRPGGARGHMLHFEMYRNGGDHSTLRSQRGPYQRRADIMDPAPYLDEWVHYLP
jgi:murein DD-endopeptidase MepM/ murein hydrolase activator NlpD